MSSAPSSPSTAASAALLSGASFALAAGLMWGLVFITPLLLPEYPAALLSVGRYLAFGLIALPLALADRRNLRRLAKADWIEALKLAAVGNLLYYLLLASAIQRAGGPLPTMIIGTLPVVIAVTSNLRDARRDGKLPWARLAPSLALIAVGIGLVNKVEIDALRVAGGATVDMGRYAIGGLLAVGAVGCWTWYPVRNADWLRAHPDRSPRTWATAQGVATLPLALIGYAVVWALLPASYAPPFGPRPGFFIAMMARHLVLERSEPTTADDARRPADRVRDAVRARLRVRPARHLAGAAHVRRNRAADRRCRVGAALDARAARGRGARELNHRAFRTSSAPTSGATLPHALRT
jgi:drug/metabolite transporter (DMT)-like permease